jgi:integrating conjugative element protein (TIGR03759 family)
MSVARSWVAVLLALSLALPAAAADTVATGTRAGASRSAPTAIDPLTKELAQSWGLSVDEIRRYQSLMRGYRGSVSVPNISPIEVLGIHARDDAERRRYAELLARIMVADAERVLAFERERIAAMNRLFPTLKVMDFGRGDGHVATVRKGAR